MKKIGNLQLNGRSLSIDEGFYDNGRIAIAIAHGMFAKLTVNVPDAPLSDGCIHVKMWGGNEQLRGPVLATGMFEDTGERVPCGLCEAEVWRYTPPQFAAFLIDPAAKSVAQVQTDGSLESVYALMGCNMIEQLYINERKDVLVVDEEPKFKAGWQARGQFTFYSAGPFIGKVLVMGGAADSWDAPAISLEAVRGFVEFV